MLKALIHDLVLRYTTYFVGMSLASNVEIIYEPRTQDVSMSQRMWFLHICWYGGLLYVHKTVKYWNLIFLEFQASLDWFMTQRDSSSAESALLIIFLSGLNIGNLVYLQDNYKKYKKVALQALSL